jgi:glycosyltransferase involved in cell wall biosynthesis
MTPVEVMSCGRPVIAFGKGGALDTVVDGVTGVYAAEQTVESFADAIVRFESLRFDSGRIALHAKRFSFSQFESAFSDVVAEVMHGTNRVAAPRESPGRRFRVISGESLLTRR